MKSSEARPDGYTLYRAIDDVFGKIPLWPWSALGVILVGGLLGSGAHSLLPSQQAGPNAALGWLACLAYGLLAAAVLSVVPRSIRLIRLWSSLSQRPMEISEDRPWWPLQLLAAALRGTPELRRTEQDFHAAVQRAGPEAYSILAHRLWPACVAAFVAPVLGLLSAWQAGKQIEIVAGQASGEVLMAFLPRVAPPMVATITLSLVLLVVLFLLDNGTRGLLQRWANTVRFSDGECDPVKQLIGDQLPPVPPPQFTGLRGGTSTPLGDGRGPPEEGPTADSLEDLGKAFSHRGVSH